MSVEHAKKRTRKYECGRTYCVIQEKQKDYSKKSQKDGKYKPKIA
ncbi:MAG: hypothetical protein ACTSPD_09590 [Promethearchaeota archaeon]